MSQLAKLAIGGLGLVWSLLCGAQGAPTVLQWRDIFQDVRQHALFRELDIRYSKAPAENVGYTPVGVVHTRATGCLVVIAEGDNPRLHSILRFGSTPQEVRTLLLLAAAHELGHCVRVRQKQMSAQFWALVAATDEGSAPRHYMERQASLEEAYADAYALVYLQDSHPALFQDGLRLMRALRTDPDFATPYYQVQPLYDQLSSHGLDSSLPPQKRIDMVVQQSRFQRN